MSQTDPSDPAALAAKRRNARLGLICATVFAAMVGAAFASVPLYRAFCQATGYDGTISRAKSAPGKALDKKLLIRFDANVRDLPWDFNPEQTTQTVKIGETGLAYFRVTNNSNKPITGHAVYNVVPEQAGAHFRKLECFCFSDQTIPAGKTIEFPVVYFVDPAYATDYETKNQGQVTLSYTFYPAVGAKQAQAAQERAPSVLGGKPSAGL